MEGNARNRRHRPRLFAQHSKDIQSKNAGLTVRNSKCKLELPELKKITGTGSELEINRFPSLVRKQSGNESNLGIVF